jgi:hypothetical protein
MAFVRTVAIGAALLLSLPGVPSLPVSPALPGLPGFGLF